MDPPEQNKKSLSFGFSKKHETVKLKKSAVVEHIENEDTTKDFVLSLEGKEVKSTKADRDKKKTKDYHVIPLINQNRWRVGNQDASAGEGNTSDNLDLLAAEEILKDSARLNDEWGKKDLSKDTTRTVPLLMQNKVPEGFETDNKFDVDLRPEEPNDADYDQIPIEHFGMAMLRGMGWNESRGVGKQGKVIATVEAQIRPKGLGLGADRSNKDKNVKDAGKNQEGDKSEQMELKKGSCCFVTAGSNKDLYGIVEGVDEDNCRVMIKLALTGKTVNLMQCNISLVSKKDYEKFSKYLNKQKVDEYKKRDEEKRSKRSHHGDEERQNDHYENKSKRSHKRPHSDEDRYEHNDDHYEGDHPKKHDKQEHDRSSSSHHKNSRHSKTKHKSHKKSKDYKDDEKQKMSDSSGSGEESDVSETQRPWVQHDLRVRVVDKHFKKFYKEKVVIVDVPMPKMCVCKSSDGKVIDGISQSSLETVVPKDDNSFVLIVSGPSRGQIGQIMKKDKNQCLALVQLLSDRDSVLKLSYDEICEYVGNVHARDDF